MRSPSAHQRLAVIATRQHSVFSRSQALDAGLSERQVDYALAIGRWLVLERAVYATAGAALVWESHVMAAVLASRRPCAASRRTAAALLEAMERTAGPVDIIVAHAAHDGVHPTRSSIAPSSSGPARSSGPRPIPVTRPARTLVDLAGVVTAAELEAALDSLLNAGRVSVSAVQRFIVDRHLEHRPGVGRLGRLLDDRRQGVTATELERRFRRLIADAALPQPVRQHRIGRYRVDFAYPDRRIAIEVDGFGTHGSRTAFQDDRTRQNDLVLAGWLVLRFTWDDVKVRPGAVAATVDAALRGSLTA